ARRVPARWAARGARTVPLRPERQRAAIPPRDALLGGRRPHAAGPEPDGSVPPGSEHAALSVREQAAGAVALLVPGAGAARREQHQRRRRGTGLVAEGRHRRVRPLRSVRDPPVAHAATARREPLAADVAADLSELGARADLRSEPARSGARSPAGRPSP